MVKVVSLRKVKSFKLRDRYVKILKFLGIVLCICLGVFIFYSKQISSLTKFASPFTELTVIYPLIPLFLLEKYFITEAYSSGVTRIISLL